MINFSLNFRRVEAIPSFMLSTFISELHGDISMLRGTGVLSSFFSSCMIMTIGSGQVMGHAQWILTVEDKESQGTNEENRLALHQNQHILSCKSYQRTSVLVMEVICEPQNIAKVLDQTVTSCKHVPLTISMPYIHNSTRRDRRKNQRTAWFPESSN